MSELFEFVQGFVSLSNGAQHSEKYPKSSLKKPRIKNELAGALRYTFGLTDVAPSDVRAGYNLLLGTKYQPVLFLVIIFKFKF